MVVDEYIYHPVITKEFNWMLVIRKFISIIAISMQITCVYLSFGSNDKVYSSCCNKCHKMVEKKCSKCAETKIKRSVHSMNIKAMEIASMSGTPASSPITTSNVSGSFPS